MKIVLVEPNKKARICEIENTLDNLREIVGGSIEVVYPYADLVGICCNEEGKIEGLPLNRALRDEDGNIYDIIAGTFMVLGLSADDFQSLSDELAERYLKLFYHPEAFMQTSRGIEAIQI